ncbi:hypothetical protein ABFA07_009929 [Porites harrisoni]
MALAFGFPTFHPTSYNSFFNQVVPGYGFLQDLWRSTALFCEEQARQKKLMKTYSGPVIIAWLPLNQYKPEEISLYVDDQNITLHGQHRSEGEDGFENSEFMKTIKLPEDVDPTTVTSHVTRNGSVLVLNGIKRLEKKIKANDDKFVAKLNLRGFKPEEIKIQTRGNELMVIAKHRSEEDGSRDYRRRILLPDDADLSSLTSHLCSNGVLIIEVSRDQAFLQDEAKQEASGNTEFNQRLD